MLEKSDSTQMDIQLNNLGKLDWKVDTQLDLLESFAKELSQLAQIFG